MIVVSDASPLITLLNVGRLDLLRELYGGVVIPTAVLDEVAARGPVPGFPPGWVAVRDPAGPPPAETAGLGAGETAALTLAREVVADGVVIDERRGRAVAAALGLRPVGLLAVVVEAKRAGLIPAVGPVLDELVAAKFRLSAALRADILELADEADVV